MPLTEPITVADARARLGIRTDQRDAEIARLISAARAQIEDYSGRLLVRRSHVQYGTAFCSARAVALQVAPVHALEKVEHVDADGVVSEVAGARLSTINWPVGKVYPAVGESWPIGGEGYAITLDAGYDNEDADDALHVPDQLMQALLLLVAHWFENHEAAVMGGGAVELPFGVRDLCMQFRLPGIE